MLVCGVTIYKVPYLKCQEGNESLYPWVRSELDNWDQYQVVRLAAGSGRGSPSPIPTESAVSLTHTHTHTTEGTCTHVQTHTLEGLLRLPNCDLTKMLIIVKWTPPYPRFPYELFILLLWFQPFFHEVTAPFSVWIQASTDFLLLLFFSIHLLIFPISLCFSLLVSLIHHHCWGADLLCLIKLLPLPDES